MTLGDFFLEIKSQIIDPKIFPFQLRI